MYYFVDYHGNQYKDKQGTLCDVIECDDYFAPAGAKINILQGTSLEEAIKYFELTKVEEEDSMPSV